MTTTSNSTGTGNTGSKNNHSLPWNQGEGHSKKVSVSISVVKQALEKMDSGIFHQEDDSIPNDEDTMSTTSLDDDQECANSL